MGLIPYAGKETEEEKLLFSSGPEKPNGCLTRRQRQVLELAEEGLTTREIAARLGLARASAGKHLQKARQNVAYAATVEGSADD